MNNNNYICARWRDASDCPPIGRRVPVILTDGRMSADRPYDIGDGMARWNDHVVQWLDITDTPAVPRAAVQAAVDEIHTEAVRRDVRTNGYGCNDDLIYALDEMRDHTGVTP